MSGGLDVGRGCIPSGKTPAVQGWPTTGRSGRVQGILAGFGASKRSEFVKNALKSVFLRFWGMSGKSTHEAAARQMSGGLDVGRGCIPSGKTPAVQGWPTTGRSGRVQGILAGFGASKRSEFVKNAQKSVFFAFLGHERQVNAWGRGVADVRGIGCRPGLHPRRKNASCTRLADNRPDPAVFKAFWPVLGPPNGQNSLKMTQNRCIWRFWGMSGK